MAQIYPPRTRTLTKASVVLCAIRLHKGDNYSRRDIPNGRDWGTAPADYSRFLRPKTWCSARNTLTPRGENIITFIYDAKSPTPVPPRAIPVPKTGAFAGSLVDEKITDKNTFACLITFI